jgi:pectate lyase
MIENVKYAIISAAASILVLGLVAIPDVANMASAQNATGGNMTGGNMTTGGSMGGTTGGPTGNGSYESPDNGGWG